jgi:murein DD-endopeptidase MepM/ murein hydrolase activator NlpD
MAKLEPLVDTLITSVALGLMVTTGTNIPYHAHFLQEHVGFDSDTASSLSTFEIIVVEEQSSASSSESTPIIMADVPASSAQASSIEPLRPAAQIEESISSTPLSSSSSSVAIVVQESYSSEESSSIASDTFPAFGNAVHPVQSAPNWGAMTTPEEWERSYGELNESEFVAIPSYDLPTLMTPMGVLKEDRYSEESIRILTAKLYYSTRYFGAYDLDAHEFSGVHPGIDLKLAEGTPVGTVAGGRVHAIRNESGLGLHVIIEHRTNDGEAFYSVYGHLSQTSVTVGEDVSAGQMIGIVGMSGETTAPHLHLQIDRGEPNETSHQVYWPSRLPSPSEAAAFSVNPIQFIAEY